MKSKAMKHLPPCLSYVVVAKPALTPQRSRADVGALIAWRRQRVWRQCKHHRYCPCQSHLPANRIASTCAHDGDVIRCPRGEGFHLRNGALARLAVPDTDGVTLDGGLAAEGADVAGVLGDFHLLDGLTEGSTVSLNTAVSLPLR